MRRFLNVFLTILLTAVVFGGGAFYFEYQKATSDKEDLNNQISDLRVKLTTAEQQLAAAQQAQQTAATPAANYLQIKELGVKIKLSDDIKDLAYSMSGGSSAMLSTKSLADAAKAANSKCDPSTSALGQIMRQPAAAKAPANSTALPAIGANKFYYIASTGPCSTDPSVQSTQNSQINSVKAAAASLSAI